MPVNGQITDSSICGYILCLLIFFFRFIYFCGWGSYATHNSGTEIKMGYLARSSFLNLIFILIRLEINNLKHEMVFFKNVWNPVLRLCCRWFFCDFIECFELKYFFLLLSGVLRRIYSHSSRIQPVAGREWTIFFRSIIHYTLTRGKDCTVPATTFPKMSACTFVITADMKS